MEKQTIKIPLEIVLDWAYSIEINKLKQDLDEAEKLGATHINIQTYVNYNNYPYSTIKAIIQRLETDEEFNQRIIKENLYKTKCKKEELKQLAALKAKYE